jgi:hypothetical protein
VRSFAPFKGIPYAAYQASEGVQRESAGNRLNMRRIMPT